jgi:glycosyltransferase involved in cell wall biosynthesis
MVSILTNNSVDEPFARIARWLGRGFEELGVPFDVVYLEGPEGVSGNGVRTVRLGKRRSRSSILPITRYLREARPSYALVTPGHLSPFAIAAGRLAKVPVIPWEATILHFDLPTRGWTARALYYVQRLGYPGAPMVAAVSKDVETHFLERSFRQKPFYVLPNPVDPQELRALAGEGHRDEVFRFCALGKLRPQKGYDTMLRAFGRAKDALPPKWELIVMGEGELREELTAIAEEEGLAGHVRFEGYVENPYATLASADVFVHSARWEGCPVAVLEAVALGMPIVATDCPGGTRDILANGSGVLVPMDDPSALADALVTLAASDSLREELAVKARRQAEEFTPIRSAQRVLGLRDRIATHQYAPSDGGRGAQEPS